MNAFDDLVLDDTSFSWLELIGQSQLSTWTPANANVTLTINGTCKYLAIGPLLIAQYDVTWPVTGDGNAAQITGLPFTANANGRFVHIPNGTAGRYVAGILAPSTSLIALVDNSGGAIVNATLSTFRLAGVAVYFT